VRRPTYIARQSAKPSGAIGRVIAWIMARETAELNEQAIGLLAVKPSDSVLEVGFGHGYAVERIAAAAPQCRVTGIDHSEAMTQLATRRIRRAGAAGRVELRTGDCAALPFAEHRFDKALSVHTIYFWIDPLACLREVRRVLRPGAHFVLGFTGRGSSLSDRFPAEVYTFYDDDQVRGLLADAGFDSVELTRVGEAVLAVASVSNQRTR
jgi:ubiquinone/menaquinone biosynthesis C-methylase UbiE